MTETHLFEAPPSNRLRLVCPACGSHEVVYGSLIRWSPEARRWRLFWIGDEGRCADCGESFPGAETVRGPSQ